MTFQSSLLRTHNKLLSQLNSAPSLFSLTLFESTLPKNATLLKTIRCFSSSRTNMMWMKNSSTIKTYKINALYKTQRSVTNGNKPEGKFLRRWMAPREMPQRGTLKWYGEMVLICTVFAITGTSTMVMVSICIFY